MSREALEPHFVRKVQSDNKYTDRLKEEFALIDKFGFTKVFLQVQQIIEITRERKIPHIIRGSAGSSLVCFLLGITEIDPILYKLELARFMNHGRQDLPDIDIDVPYNRREELYKAIENNWSKKVARISNHVHYGMKTALRETAKEILLQTPASKERAQKLQQLQRRDFSLGKILSPEDQALASQRAKELNGKVKYNSLHCGGIVIFEEEEEVPAELLIENYQPID
jgi:error-prone DNA polymerase